MIDTSSIDNKCNLYHFNSFHSAISDAKAQSKLESSLKRKRAVRFYPLVSTQETIHILDYTPAEKVMCWYSEAELAQILSEIQQIMANPQTLPDDPEYRCAMCRGLEGMTPQGWKRRQEHREAGWKAVKRNSHTSSYESVSYSAIAMAYRLTTQLAVLEAKKRASDEDFSISFSQSNTIGKDPKQCNKTKLSPCNSHSKRVGTLIRKMLRRISGH
jgi:hypothetical protein